MRRTEVEVGCLPLILFLVFETGSLTQRGSCFLVRLTGNELQFTSACPGALGLQTWAALFCRCWSSEHKRSCSHSEPFIYRAVSQHPVRQCSSFQPVLIFAMRFQNFTVSVSLRCFDPGRREPCVIDTVSAPRRGLAFLEGSLSTVVNC